MTVTEEAMSERETNKPRCLHCLHEVPEHFPQCSQGSRATNLKAAREQFESYLKRRAPAS